jgi:hypothetical protein
MYRLVSAEERIELIGLCYRMRSQQPGPILMRKLLNSFPRDAGLYQATRYVFLHATYMHMLNSYLGKIRRPLVALDSYLTSFPVFSVLV